MSVVIWRKVVQPPAPSSVIVPETDQRILRLPATDEEIVELSDRRHYTVLTRAGLLLCAATLPAQQILAPFVAKGPSSVAIFCAIENGPDSVACATAVAVAPPAAFSESYRAHRSGKHYFKMLANTPAAIIAIVLGLTGPIYVFNDSRRGGQHAAAQAEAELSRGSISAAILCGAFSPEDPFTIDRSYGDSLQAEMALCEGAGCLVLTPSRDRDETRKTDAGCRYFGIADHIIKLALDE